MSNTDPTIAQTILSQLGGMGRLIAMIGLKRPFHDDAGRTLVIRFMSGGKANHARITLDEGTDTYKVQAFKVRGMKCATVAELDGVHAGELISAMESVTGLAWRL